MLTRNRLKALKKSINNNSADKKAELLILYSISNIFEDTDIVKLFGNIAITIKDIQNIRDRESIYYISNFLSDYSNLAILISKFYKDNIKQLSRHEFYSIVKEETDFLEDGVSPSIRIWHILNNENTIPICINCKNKNVLVVKNKYSNYCSTKCSKSSDITRQKREDTIYNKYGTMNIMDLSDIKSKIKTTCINRYGESSPMKSIEIKDKFKKYFLDKYGVDNPSKLESIKLKKEKTYLENSAVKNPNYTDKLNNIDFLTDQHHNLKKTLLQISEELGTTVSSLSKRFNKYKIKVLPIKKSIQENEIFNFISSNYNGEVISGFKLESKKELDIYIPDLKLAFEYNGLYWHSEEQKKDKNYHLNKTIECKKKNIKLIHIFENEWILKQNIVKSRILNMIGKSKRLFARKCKIKNVSNKEKKEFLNNNHIQGDCPSSINIGLFYKGSLVVLMTFGKTRFNKQYEYELLRFCNLLNHTVIGGASRLLKNFINLINPINIISYADLRYSDGKLYKNLGFTYLHYSNPNYWYFKGNDMKLYNRIKFQKHKLKNKLDYYDSSLTEYENMLNNGYHRIFDCGNLVYKIEIQNRSFD